MPIGCWECSVCGTIHYDKNEAINCEADCEAKAEGAGDKEE